MFVCLEQDTRNSLDFAAILEDTAPMPAAPSASFRFVFAALFRAREAHVDGPALLSLRRSTARLQDCPCSSTYAFFPPTHPG